VEWINNPSNVDPDSTIGFLLRWLTWPDWMFTPGNGTMANFIAHEARAILIIGLVYGILAMLAKGIASGGVAFVVGWVAVILGAALASFIAYFIGAGNGSTFAAGLNAFSAGGTYGLFVGWIVGIAASIAKRG
jgi:hypothetical protein